MSSFVDDYFNALFDTTRPMQPASVFINTIRGSKICPPMHSTGGFRKLKDLQSRDCAVRRGT